MESNRKEFPQRKVRRKMVGLGFVLAGIGACIWRSGGGQDVGGMFGGALTFAGLSLAILAYPELPGMMD